MIIYAQITPFAGMAGDCQPGARVTTTCERVETDTGGTLYVIRSARWNDNSHEAGSDPAREYQSVERYAWDWQAIRHTITLHDQNAAA